MRKTVVILACCALIAPVAFTQTRKRQTITTEQPITVTGTVVKTTSEEGAAANYQPFKTLVVREDHSNRPGHYVLEGAGHVVNRKGSWSKPRSSPALASTFTSWIRAVHV